MPTDYVYTNKHPAWCITKQQTRFKLISSLHCNRLEKFPGAENINGNKNDYLDYEPLGSEGSQYEDGIDSDADGSKSAIADVWSNRVLPTLEIKAEGTINRFRFMQQSMNNVI